MMGMGVVGLIEPEKMKQVLRENHSEVFFWGNRKSAGTVPQKMPASTDFARHRPVTQPMSNYCGSKRALTSFGSEDWATQFAASSGFDFIHAVTAASICEPRAL